MTQQIFSLARNIAKINFFWDFLQYSAFCRFRRYFVDSFYMSEKLDFERFLRQSKNLFHMCGNPYKTLKFSFWFSENAWLTHVSPFSRFILLSLVLYSAQKPYEFWNIFFIPVKILCGFASLVTQNFRVRNEAKNLFTILLSNTWT